MYGFEFVKPFSIAEAIKALTHDGAQPLSGGKTLMPTMNQRLAQPTRLVSLTGIAERKGVSKGTGGLHIGAATPHDVVAKMPAAHHPALATPAGAIGDPAMRARGTIGGPVANNDPSADEGEVVTEVRCPIPRKAADVKFNQPASRFALTGVSVAKFADCVRVAVTGASNNGVFRWSEPEAALSKLLTPDAIAGLTVDAADLIGDLHGTPVYRAALTKVLTGRAVTAAG